MADSQKLNLMIGRLRMKLKRHDKMCAQCAEANTFDAQDHLLCDVCHGNTLQHRCDTALDIRQEILDLKDDLREAQGEPRLQS